MAEPPVNARPYVGGEGSGGLLATKLYLPRAQPGWVPRPRLLAWLDKALAHALVLVCAPAGFGKTSLLADWARQRRRPVAWLSLDAGDNDPARFWRHVVAALERVRPGLAERLAPLLSPPPSFEGLVAALINELATRPDPDRAQGDDQGEVALVLDDYHLIDSQALHASLAFLLEHRPPALHLILASRADPPLGLARRRARGQLAELREADLRFTPEEAAALLTAATGLELPSERVAALAARTEGWAAGLQLAGLSLRGQTDVEAFVASFSGSHRYVLDFLSEEVLNRQPEPLRGFLLETSVLARLSGPLCDAVTGRGDSQRLLEEVERANLFLVPLDEQRRWWRYHQLFAELLRVRLRRERPERVPALHRAAAAWLEAHGQADEAIHHALAASDPTWAARLIERHFDELLRRAEGATVDRWVAALPAELVSSRPRLRLIQAVWAIMGGRVDAVEPLLADAERALAAGGEERGEPFAPSVGRAASRVVNLPASIALVRAELARRRGDAKQLDGFARQAEAHLSGDDPAMRRQVDWDLAVAKWFEGRLAHAEPALERLVAEQRAAGESYLAVRAACDLGQVRRARGHLDAALASYQQALEIATEAGRRLPLAGMAHVGIAEVRYQRGALEAAREHATEGVRLCRQLAYTLPLLAGLAVLARIQQAHGDMGGAWATLAEAEQVEATAAGAPVTSLLDPVPALRARLLLAQGDLAAAIGWAKQRGLSADDEPSYPREPDHLVLARILLAQDRPEPALTLLRRLHAHAAGQGRTDSLLQIAALRALTLASRGDLPAALAVLGEALILAHPHGYLRVFADEGAPMRALLTHLLAAQRGDRTALRAVPFGYLARLLRAFEPVPGPAATPPAATAAPPPPPPRVAVPGLVEPLSPRELEVLRLLAAGRSNQQIADELVVALSTVKKHVNHILDKLGATNRTQATARARELGLLP